MARKIPAKNRIFFKGEFGSEFYVYRLTKDGALLSMWLSTDPDENDLSEFAFRIDELTPKFALGDIDRKPEEVAAAVLKAIEAGTIKISPNTLKN